MTPATDRGVAPHARHTTTYAPDLALVTSAANAALDELSAGSDRSAHWWVGYLSAQMEQLLSAIEAQRDAS
jgi:hypothetical protein